MRLARRLVGVRLAVVVGAVALLLPATALASGGGPGMLMWASLFTSTPAVVLVAAVQGLVLRFVASPAVRHWTGGLTLAVVALAGVLQLCAVAHDVRESGASAFPTTLMAVLVAVSLALTALSVYLGVRLVRG
jgi:hypothetical protein